nr:insulinase family protein [uncultured Bacteroides sp.]
MRSLFKNLFTASLLLCASTTFAQQQMPPIPIDKNVRIGKLENGLTYYIRKNTTNEKRADFYIAQKVGSILEEPQQRGLAHFLEHMAFNGSKNFPGTDKGLGIVPWCESVGIKFGANLNAYTSIDQTVYNISNAPVTREGILDSCLLILHDWSNDLLLTDKEIDKERGVIHEEWRSRMSAMQRLQEKALPIMYAGTKYADCMPIGTMDVVDNFKYQILRDYYEKWYRPDLQGLVIVGDIDVDAVEAKIKKIFSDIPKPVNPALRTYFPVNDNKEPIVVIEKDKEQTNMQILLFNKHDVYPDSLKNNMQYLFFDYAKNMIGNMLNARLNELTQSATPPFVYGYTYDGSFFVSKTKDAFTGVAVCKEDGVENALSTLLREIERAHRFGFTESEYVRARAEYLRNLESEYNERDKKKNEDYINSYVNNFTDNEPIPSIDDNFALMNKIAPNLPVAMINEVMKSFVSDTNQVVAIFGPDKEGLVYPAKDKILSILKNVKAENITAYVDKVSNEPLIPVAPKAGKIISTKENTNFGTTTLTLSNGVKVIVKKTDFKADEIQMKGVSLGGNSLMPNSEIINIKSLNDVVELGGLGNFSAVNLQKVLAGKKASVSSSVGTNTEGVNGSCSPKDLETMLQLTYLTFTAPRMDADAFASYKTRMKASLQNSEANPMVAFSDSVTYGMYGNHPRTIRIKADMIDKIDYQKCMDLYKDRFKDASDFTFILVGNVDLEKAKPLIEQYLGSLPSINRKETFKDTKMYTRKGQYKNEFKKIQQTAKASVFTFYNGSCKYTSQNDIMMSMLSQILDIVYTEKIREQEGGTYGVSVYGNTAKYPKEESSLQIVFQTDPAKKDKLIKIVFEETDNIAKVGPSETNLAKVKEYMLKKYKENIKENSYWAGCIDEYLYTGLDMDANYEAIVNKITISDLQKFAKSMFSQKNQVEVTMTSPEAK